MTSPDPRWLKEANSVFRSLGYNEFERPESHAEVRAVALALQKAFEAGRKVPIVNLGPLRPLPLGDDDL